MPQKKNPDALELVRAKTGRAYGHLMSLLTVMKGLPMTYNKDLQEDKEPLFDTVRTIQQCTRMVQKVLEKIRLRPERMLEATRTGYLNATELADYLVAKKVPFREAHHLVGKIVVRASELGIGLEEMPLREFQSFSPLFENDLYECLEPARAVSRRRERGGTAPEAVQNSIRLFRKKVRGK
jgi:argininosuccinate lyase